MTSRAAARPGALDGRQAAAVPRRVVELLVGELGPVGGRRAALERALRDGVRGGRLVSGARLPSSRALAAQLGVSRRLVVDAYAQLTAEGYLRTRPGAGTVVAGGAPRRPAPTRPPLDGRTPSGGPIRWDLFPGAPDLALFPRRDWLRAVRAVLAETPDQRLSYGDPAGARELRHALAERLGRVRGAAAEPRTIVVTGGFVQALRLLAEVLYARGARRIAVEDPGFPLVSLTVRAAGLTAVPIPVDDQGVDVAALAAAEPDAAVVCTAHQMPLGVALAPERRAALLTWATERDAFVIEDDYDAEFRYDREPVGALQGLAPDRVALVGTVSKVLAPGLRIGWAAVPDALLEGTRQAKALADLGNPVIDQLALARLLADGGLERQVRGARQRYRARREALLQALATELPDARVRGASAGLHLLCELPPGSDERATIARAAGRGLRLYGLEENLAVADPERPGLVLGYAAQSEAELRLAAAVLADCVG